LLSSIGRESRKGPPPRKEDARSGSKAAAPTALIFCCDSIFLFSVVPLLIPVPMANAGLYCTLGLVVRQIV
jgi:hypothetical protein